MKINYFRRVSVILLTILILISSTGASVDFHYCKGDLISFAFFKNAKSCIDLSENKSCHFSNKLEHQIKKQSCCKNKCFSVKQFEESTQPILCSVKKLLVVKNNFPIISSFKVLYIPYLTTLFNITYKPPLSDKQFLVDYQAFLL